MKITAKQGGGFAGGERCVELDTACRADGGALEALVRQLDFFGTAPPCGVGADIPRWEITVEDGAQRKTVTLLDDGSLAATAWPALLEHLRGAA